MYVASILSKDEVQIMASNCNFVSVRAPNLGKAKEFMRENYPDHKPCHYTTVGYFKNVLGGTVHYRSYSFLNEMP